jgi:hypothetical protein
MTAKAVPGHRKPWTAVQVRRLGVRTTVPVAGEILAGLGKDESYRAVKRGDFPVPVLKVGRHLIVPVAPILEFLRLDGGLHSRSGNGEAGPDPPSSPAATHRSPR